MSEVVLGERVQRLWGGYGEIRRAELRGAANTAVIVKQVVPPKDGSLDAPELRSHRRKLRSYQVECTFYQSYARRCGARCRVPGAVYADAAGESMLLVLEDLDVAGFALRRHRLSLHELERCLCWLAQFHATFLHTPPEGLWKVGSYWHLATRPDELGALRDPALRRAAPRLDECLNGARYRTLVHGDAKVQNFCFAPDARDVAAVDFQYVGGGVGVKDVAYLLTSCLSAPELQRNAEAHLDTYFRLLRGALEALGSRHERAAEVSLYDFDALEREWRELYPVACADFYRFLLGWAGEPNTRDAYLERVTRDVLATL